MGDVHVLDTIVGGHRRRDASALRPAAVSQLGVLGDLRLLLVAPWDRGGLWSGYRDGAAAAYARYGLDHVLGLPATAEAGGRLWFAVAVDERARVVGGLRVCGPLRTVADAAVLREFAGYPVAVAAIERVLLGALGDGVGEVKGYWVDHDQPDRHELAAALAGTVVTIGSRLGLRHLFCTSAGHATQRWLDAGAVWLRSVPAVPFPDARYRTLVQWWDRDNPASMPVLTRPGVMPHA